MLLTRLLLMTIFLLQVLCDKGLGVGVSLLGKVVLGPQLYLGVPKGDSPSGVLSHWGKALSQPGPIKFWHVLYE